MGGVELFARRFGSRTPPVGDLPVAALQPDLVADDVAALIRHYGAARADVLGFSYGGGIAMRLADQYPGLVRSLILASTTAYRDYEREREAAADYQARARLCTEIDDWHRVLAGVRFSSDWNAPHAAGRLRPGTPDNAEDILRTWARPVLILHGSRDMTFPVSHARKLHAALPASTLAEIPDAAHMTHFDNPQAWLAGIRRFLHATR